MGLNPFMCTSFRGLWLWVCDGVILLRCLGVRVCGKGVALFRMGQCYLVTVGFF